LTADRPLDPNRFVSWIQKVTQEIGTDILRMKGIIAMKDDHERFVIQGVHMLLEGGSQRPWKVDEKRDSRLVFIGRGLPRERLKQEFESCFA
jgi:G3E family GTPase